MYSPLPVAFVLPGPGEWTGLAVLTSSDRPDYIAHHRPLDRYAHQSKPSGTWALPWRQRCHHPTFESKGKVRFFASAGSNWAAETQHDSESNIMALRAHSENRRKMMLPWATELYKYEEGNRKRNHFSIINTNISDHWKILFNFSLATYNMHTNTHIFFLRKNILQEKLYGLPSWKQYCYLLNVTEGLLRNSLWYYRIRKGDLHGMPESETKKSDLDWVSQKWTLRQKYWWQMIY